MKRHFCQFDPALSFCVVFFPCTRARLEANWRNCNDVANDIALIDRKTLHNMSTPVSRHQSHDIPSHTRQNEKGCITKGNGGARLRGRQGTVT